MELLSNPLMILNQAGGPERMILLIIGTLGLISIINKLSAILKWTWVTFLRPGKNLKKYGSWAIVTGPTDGIGRGFAKQLASRKINLVLVGRTLSKLTDLADELQSKYKIQAKTVVVDFSGNLVEGMSRVEEAINDLDVGLLINNVGVSYPYARFFHEVDSELLKNLIAVNIEGTTRMVHTVLPFMLKKKKGAIVNLGSGAATVIPSDPLYTVYAATKAYIDQFSRSLYVEYKHSGIDIQCQVPLYVATKMASIKRASLLVPSPDTFAHSALRWVGYEPRCTPYWVHSIIWWLASVLPEPLVDAYRLKFSVGIRKRGLMKDSRKKE
ncbi:very-long-chain 3-oxoacyl-CoA reductase 1 [Cryptomeria japonica]|uniref:very-long-chain 3-oxoacyl-CoA reductase 1 n=1 Tax=Cryptomeria japonica TaxID=3369 RepID=UPI0025AD7A75|nr:very-long-chain 3-oxoacyl-CoA reductase 1 [Cryptomeria japonica]XP_057827237.1 very-long-chain 3-oxoacyl-CoA reductase 1 [Cryptomeria japonica]